MGSIQEGRTIPPERAARTVSGPFVGRSHELALVRSRLAAARGGTPQVVLLAGEPGIGKSWLLRSVQRMAIDQGFAVLPGRCMEHFDLPYFPFQSALLPRLAEFARAEPDLATSAELLGRALDPPDEPRPLTDGAAANARARFLHAAARVAICLARRQPVLVTVDDLHWADGPSVDLFVQVALEASDAAVSDAVPLLLTATMRPETGGRLQRDVARLTREENCHRIELGPLDEAAAGALLSGLGFAHVSRQLVDGLRRATGGNPLLLRSMAPRILDSRVREEGGELVAAGSLEDIAIPDELSAAIGKRIDELPGDARELLAVAAILGDPFTVDAVVAVSGTARSAVSAAVDRAVDLEILVRDDAALSFGHPTFARVLRVSTSASRRAEIHLAAAHSMAESVDRDSNAILTIGMHVAEAGAAADAPEAVAACRAAGERAWQLGAWGEAARYFEAAAAAARRVDASSHDLADLLARAGAAHCRNLDPGPGRARLQEAVELFQAQGNVTDAVRSLLELAHVDVTWSSFGRPVDVEQLSALLPEVEESDPVLCARGYVQLAEASWSQGRLARADRYVDRALELAERGHTASVRSRALLARAQAAWLRLDLHGAHDALVTAIESARGSTEPWLAGLPLPRMALTLFWMGRLFEARSFALDARADTERYANFAEKSLALSVLTCVAVARGEFEQAEQCGEEAVAAIRISKYTWSASLVFPALVMARLLQDDVLGARSALDQWSETVASLGDTGYDDSIELVDLLIDLHAEGPERMRNTLAARLGGGRIEQLAALFGMQHVSALVELADAGMPAGERDRWRAGLDYAMDQGMQLSEGLVMLLPRVRADLCVLEGRLDEAAAGYRAAIGAAESMGSLPELARAQLGLARLLRDHDADAAGELALRAASIFASLHMPVFEHEARALAAERGLPASDPVRAPLLPAPQGKHTVVLLFTDVVDSTRLTEELGDEQYLALAQALDHRVRESIGEHGGRTEDGVRPGDGLLAVFASGEDAILSADLAHEHAASLGLRLHVGVHVGDVIHSRTGVHGTAVNIAARVCAMAPPGRTVVSAALRSVVGARLAASFEEFGSYDLKGIAEPQLLFVAGTAPAR